MGSVYLSICLPVFLSTCLSLHFSLSLTLSSSFLLPNMFLSSFSIFLINRHWRFCTFVKIIDIKLIFTNFYRTKKIFVNVKQWRKQKLISFKRYFIFLHFSNFMF